LGHIHPFVSVVLPVYNCPTYVGVAIESILNQKFENFEFLIIDDGSTDDTPQILKKYSDSRIRHIRHENKGLAGTLNVGINLARGKYIARQDQDDISLPERLSSQFAYMEEHPECGLLGTWAQIMEENRLVQRFHRHPVDPYEIKYFLMFNNPFVHSSVMIRKSVLEQVGGYSTDPERQPPEDYELWSRISRVSGVANLSKIFLHYREIPTSMSRQGPAPFRARLVKLSAENIAYIAGIDLKSDQTLNIAALIHGAPELVKKPNFRSMEKILNQSARNLWVGSIPESIVADLHGKIPHLRAIYFSGKNSLLQWVINRRSVRTILKKLVKVFLFRIGR
jgi:glycosyltransferase involved in cell wall biosynthesis